MPEDETQTVIVFAYGAGGGSGADGGPTEEETDAVLAGFTEAGLRVSSGPDGWFPVRWRLVAPRADVKDLDWLVRRRWVPRSPSSDQSLIDTDIGADTRAALNELKLALMASEDLDANSVLIPLFKVAYSYAMNEKNFPVIADCLFYLRHGEGIRNAATAVLADARAAVDARRDKGEPVHLIALGHSLGGLALVDALTGQTAAPSPDLLVTCGSQAGFLIASDAMGLLRRGASSPAPFAPWLNVWNPNDYLSYPVVEKFGTFRGHIEDRLGQSSSSYPAVHDGYWADHSWQPRVKELLP